LQLNGYLLPDEKPLNIPSPGPEIHTPSRQPLTLIHKHGPEDGLAREDCGHLFVSFHWF
jgi:hypothetical protein